MLLPGRYAAGVNPGEFDAREWFQCYFWMRGASMRAARGGSTPTQGMGTLYCPPLTVTSWPVSHDLHAQASLVFFASVALLLLF